MTHKTKIALLTGLSLLAAGLALFAAALSAYHWDFTRLNTVKFETTEFSVGEAFRGISLDAASTDVRFVPSEDGACRVVCRAPETTAHSVSVQDGVLTVQATDAPWHEHIGIFFSSPEITLCLPAGDYGALSLCVSTGDVSVPADFSFTDVSLAATTGDVSFAAPAADTLTFSSTTGTLTVTDVSCRSLSTAGSTGEVLLHGVTAAERISVERSTGDVVLDRCDAADVFVKTSTGSITATLLTEKTFTAQSSTGRVSVPESGSGGSCTLLTSTGDIRASLAD